MITPREDHPIDSYLDELLGALRMAPDRTRRILSKRKTTCERPPPRWSRRGSRHRRLFTRRSPLRRTARCRAAFRRSRWARAGLQGRAGSRRPGFLRDGSGSVAIGTSGLLALIFALTSGKAFIFGDAPGVVYTAERCGDYARLAPRVATCATQPSSTTSTRSCRRARLRAFCVSSFPRCSLSCVELPCVPRACAARPQRSSPEPLPCSSTWLERDSSCWAECRWPSAPQRARVHG